MFELTFNETVCKTCPTGDCLVKCQYMTIEAHQARDEMLKIFRGEDSPVLQQCVTCYACEEYCVRGNHPFYLITQRREEKEIITAPRAFVQQWINIGEPRGKYKLGEIKERALSFGFMPQFLDIVKGKLFEDVMPSFFFGQEFFCNVVYIHFGNTSLIKKRLPLVIENIKNLGVQEVIFMHDECYAAFTSLAPAFGIEVPFRSIHYFAYLYERLQHLRDEIRPLGITAAYQRPCSNRLCPETHQYVAKIMELIGVKLVARSYQDDGALCCGSIFRSMYGYDLAHDVQTRNIDDMTEHGAEYCVFNCHGCQNALKTPVLHRGIEPIHIVELCRRAIGEGPDTEGE